MADHTNNKRKNYTNHPEYERLPIVVKHTITPKQYAWLGRENRERLQSDLTNPEVYDEGGT